MVIQYDNENDPRQSEHTMITRQPSPSRNGSSRMSSSPESIGQNPLELWRNMNVNHLPLYGTQSSNIFLQMQEQPLLGSCAPLEEEPTPVPESGRPLFYLSLPPPDDLVVEDNTQSFLSSRMDAFLGFQDCFTSAYNRLYLLSAFTPPLRHVLLAFVKYLNQRDRFSQSDACMLHISKALPPLQHAITNLNFDEGHILCIPMLAYLAFWWGKEEVAKSHIRGFYKMLLHAQFLRQDHQGHIYTSKNIPSLLLLMWRVAIRLDHSFGFMRPDDEIFPPLISDLAASRRYISEFIAPGSAGWTDWLILTDDLEDIRNLAVHFNGRTEQVRGSNTYTPVQGQAYIERAGQKIIARIQNSKVAILQAADEYHTQCGPYLSVNLYVELEPFPSAELGRYVASLQILHHRFIVSLIANRVCIIHATMTMNPRAGPNPPERLDSAIEICCAFYVLKKRTPLSPHDRGRLLEALLFAGYAFCNVNHFLGSCPPLVVFGRLMWTEFQWVQNQLSEELAIGHIGASRIRDLLTICWESPNLTPWDLVKVGII
jgi:hypothetical protein